jgi:hypothetical protein
MLSVGLEVSMPNICFSYLTDVPPDSQNLSAMRSAPAGLRRMPLPCFSYPAMCFGYPPDALGVRNPDAAQPPVPGLRRMTGGTCFRY